MECIECEKAAEWCRVTQFAGTHPYCDGCAKGEKDFGESDSYAFWRKVDK